MKLRNKKTGEIVRVTNVYAWDNPKWYTSLKELLQDYEDVSEEPLIKDEKIRNAVRAWAKAFGICECKYDDFWKTFRYEEYSIGFSYIFTPKFGELTDGMVYNISELCGEDEE